MALPRKFKSRRMKVVDGELEKRVAFEGKRLPLWQVLLARKKRAKTSEEYSANDDYLCAQ